VPHLSKLCNSLATAMIGAERPTPLHVCGEGSVPSREAVSLGLIVTDLELNALKRASKTIKSIIPSPLHKMSRERIGSCRLRDSGINAPAGASVPVKAGHGTALSRRSPSSSMPEL
jgi:hypothetical protein